MVRILTLFSVISLLISCGGESSKSMKYFNEQTNAKSVVVSRIEAAEGMTDTLATLIKNLAEQSRKADGNLCYNIYQDIDSTSKFIIYQVWANDTVQKANAKSNCITAFCSAKAGVLKGDVVSAMYERSEAEMPKSGENSLTLFAKITAFEDKAEGLQTILESLIAPTLAEVGAEHYELHLLRGTPNVFLYHETWTTVPHWDAHMKTDHLVGFLNVKSDYVDGDIAISRTKQIF